MLLETTNTYEAAWYLMNGAYLSRIDFQPVDNNGLHYKIILEIKEPRFIYYWQKGRPIGNIKDYMITRVQLKRIINDAKTEYRNNQVSQIRVQE